MKKLVFIRHATAESSHPDIPDFERALKRRGNRDAGVIADKIRQQAVFPDLIIVSPARRALETASAVADVFQFPDTNLIAEDKLYPGSLEELAEVIAGIHEQFSRVFIIGHNPVISEYVSILVQQDISMKTSCAVICDIPGKWADLTVAEQFMVLNS